MCQREVIFYRSCNCVRGFALHVCRVRLPHASATCICHMHLPRTSAVRICHIFGSNASLCSQKSNPATLSCLMYKIFQITESRIEIATFLSLISNSIIEIRHIWQAMHRFEPLMQKQSKHINTRKDFLWQNQRNSVHGARLEE